MDAIPERRCSSNGSPYSEDLCYFPPVASAESVHYAYVCDKSARVEPEKQAEEHKAGTEKNKTSILVTVSSNILEFKVFRNQSSH